MGGAEKQMTGRKVGLDFHWRTLEGGTCKKLIVERENHSRMVWWAQTMMKEEEKKEWFLASGVSAGNSAQATVQAGNDIRKRGPEGRAQHGG